MDVGHSVPLWLDRLLPWRGRETRGRPREAAEAPAASFLPLVCPFSERPLRAGPAWEADSDLKGPLLSGS